MIAIWEHFLSDIKHGENIDVYIIITLAVVVAILSLIGAIPLGILSTAILATLGVLAYSTLATRRLLSELSKSIALHVPQARTPLLDRGAFGSFRDSLNGVSTICLYGPSLHIMLSSHKEEFREKIRHGGDVRVLIFNPSSTNLAILADNLGVRQREIKSDITEAIEKCIDLIQGGLGIGKFEVRQTEMMPGYSMVIFNPSEQNGQMTVEFIGYHTIPNQRPHVELEATRDGRWFTFYLNQFDELWKSAAPIVFDDPSSQIQPTR